MLLSPECLRSTYLMNRCFYFFLLTRNLFSFVIILAIKAKLVQLTMRYIFVEKLHFLVDFLEINDIMLVRGKSHCIYYGYLHNIKRDVSNLRVRCFSVRFKLWSTHLMNRCFYFFLLKRNLLPFWETRNFVY